MEAALAKRPSLLFITPVVPEDAGNGLAMRGAVFLRALAPLYTICLHVVPVFAASADPAGSPCAAETCAEAAVQPVRGREDPLYRMVAGIGEPRLRLAALAGYSRPGPCRFATAEAVAGIRSRHAGRAFDAVHVSRFDLASFAAPFLDTEAGAPRPVCRLDLDDLESRTARRLAQLHAANGDEARAYLERAEAAKYAHLEDAWLPRFDAVYTAGGADRAALAGRYGARRGRFVHVPNAVRVPAEAPPPTVARRDATGPLTLLFVGTLNYYPNEDAALLLCRDVLPLLRELAIARASPSVSVCREPAPSRAPPEVREPGITSRRFEPGARICSATWVWAPAPMATMAMTAATPMTMPSMVSALRSALTRRARSAMRRPSRNVMPGP